MKKLYHYSVMLVLSIFSVIFLIVFEAAAFTQFVLFQPDIYSEAMITGRVDDVIYNDLAEYFTGFSGPTGIPAEIFIAPLSKEDLFNSSYTLTVDSLAYLTGSTSTKPSINYDFSRMENYVDAYIEQYSEHNHIPKDESYYKLINNTHATIESQITGQLDVTMLYQLTGSGYSENLRSYAGYVKYGVIISGVVLAFLIMLIVVIDRKHPRDLPYWFGVILAASSAILLAPAVYLDKINYFDRFFMRSDNIYKTVTSIFHVSLDRIINAQTLMLILGVFLIILTVVIHMFYLNYLKKKQRHER